MNDITTYLSPLITDLAGSAAPLPPDTEPEIAKLNKLKQLLYAQLGRESRYNMHIMQDHALDEPVRVLELETDVLTFIHKQPLPVSVLFECEVDEQYLWRIASRYPAFQKSSWSSKPNINCWKKLIATSKWPSSRPYVKTPWVMLRMCRL